MPLATSNAASQPTEPATTAELKESFFDRFAGMLLALLMVVGFSVLSLLFIWFASRPARAQKVIPVTLAEVEGGGDPDGTNVRDEPEGGVDEIMEAQTAPPTSPSLVTGAIVANAELLETVGSGDVLSGIGRGGGRRKGPGGEGNSNAVPRQQRWEIRWPPVPNEIYALQLDFFGIELAAVGGGSKDVDFAGKFSHDKPETRVATPDSGDNRLYFSHRGSSRRLDTDRELLAKAGIATTNRVVLQFIPAETEDILAALERQHGGGRKTEEIGKTIFGVRVKDAGYEFYVLEQHTRAGF